MIDVIYKGKNISEEVSIIDCYHDMYAEQRTDTLHITFDDSEHIWDSWGVKTNDEISVEYGAIKTGTMFVYSGPLSYVMDEIIDTKFDDNSGYDHEIISRKQQLMPKLSVILKQM